MGIFVDYVYSVNLALIRAYKFMEYIIFKFFSGYLTRKIITEGEKLGIVFHLPGKLREDVLKEDEKRILAKSGYSSLCQIKINSNLFFPKVANLSMIAIGEEYMNGGWQIVGSDDDITEFITRVLESNVFAKYFHPFNRFLNYMELHAFNLQTTKGAFEIADKHYDLGNDLFESFLDPCMQYTCGYWAKADNLNDAQLHKMELIAKKLDLKPGMRVVDVGCGWGGLCKYLAENYGVECVGITVGAEGVKYTQKQCKGLPVEFRVQDYRELNEKFDRIVSVGMFEHVGAKNYRQYFKVLHECLEDDGIFLLHMIGVNHKNMPLTEQFTHTYIFPNGCLPYYKHITEMTEGLFIIEDWHNFGPDYVKTLRAWRENFQRNWPTIANMYGEKFYRMWNFYLCIAASLFKSRKTQLWQIVLSKDGLRRVYRAAR